MQFSRAIMYVVLAISLAGCAIQDTTETVLVGGATGRQGNAVVDELLARGYRVRALTRSPEGKKALALADRGVEVVQGNYGDRDSLDVAMNGVQKVFFYSGFSRNERAEGLTVLAAARDAGISHLIYSSGAAAEPGKGISGAKMDIELAIIESGQPYTVFRPVAFMENYAGQQKRIAKAGITDSRAPDRELHFIAVRDIGLFVGEAFDNPDRWGGVAVNVAGDALTVQEHVDVFSDVMGRPVAYRRLPLEEFLSSLPKPLRPLFRWYDEVGYEADVEGFRQQFPQLTTLEQYLQSNGWSDSG